MREIQAGDPESAAKRVAFIQDLAMLELTESAYGVADLLVQKNAIPSKAAADALHIAVCAVNGVDYLLTWNCKHINNPRTRHLIDNLCRDAGYEPCVICTPEEILEA